MSSQVSINPFFSPTQISGCILWLDAADSSTLFADTAGTIPASLTNTRVALWKDKSSSVNNASNASSPPSITYNSQNNLPAITFNGSQFLNLDIQKANILRGTFFIVTKTVATGTRYYFAFGSVSPAINQTDIRQFGWNGFTLNNNTYLNPSINDTTIYDNQFVLVTTRYSAVSSIEVPGFSGWDNGTPFDGTNNQSYTYNDLITTSQFASVGSSYLSNTRTAFLNGQICEICYYGRFLPDVQRQQIEGYLAWKWGLQASLPANHPYKNSIIPPLLNPSTRNQQITSASWQPTSIALCEIWFDAADTNTIVANGTTLINLRNKGTAGSGADISVSSGTAFTFTEKNNGLNSIRLDAGVFLVFNASFTSQARTRFFVIKPLVNTSTTNLAFLNQNNLNVSGCDFCELRGSFGALEFATGVSTNIRTAALPNQQDNVFIYTFLNASTANNNRISFNGNTQSLIASLPAASYLTSSSSIFINRNRPGDTVTSAQILCEYISYNSELTILQVQQVEGYLAWKWGVQGSLPATHPFKRWPPPPG